MVLRVNTDTDLPHRQNMEELEFTVSGYRPIGNLSSCRCGRTGIRKEEIQSLSRPGENSDIRHLVRGPNRLTDHSLFME